MNRNGKTARNEFIYKMQLEINIDELNQIRDTFRELAQLTHQIAQNLRDVDQRRRYLNFNFSQESSPVPPSCKVAPTPTRNTEKGVLLFEPSDFRKIITFPQLVKLTGINQSTLRTWVNQGLIPGFRAGNKHTRWQFRREALEEWWKKMSIQVKP